MLRQLKNYFPDSRLNSPESEAIIGEFLSNPDKSASMPFDDFVRLLVKVQKPADLAQPTQSINRSQIHMW